MVSFCGGCEAKLKNNLSTISQLQHLHLSFYLQLPTMRKLIFNVVCPFRREGKMSLCFTVEKLDDVGEVHVVLQDDVPVDLHQRQGDEEDKVTRGDTLGGPDGFPDCEHVIVHQLWEKKNKTKHK